VHSMRTKMICSAWNRGPSLPPVRILAAVFIWAGSATYSSHTQRLHNLGNPERAREREREGTYNGPARLRDENENQAEVPRIKGVQIAAELAGAGLVLHCFIEAAVVRIVDAGAGFRGPGGWWWWCCAVCHFRLFPL
jgi:hypothetical protein